MCSSHRTLNVAVVGATGMVGQEMLRILAQRRFPVAKLKALASERSEGLEVRSDGITVPVENARMKSPLPCRTVDPVRASPIAARLARRFS